MTETALPEIMVAPNGARKIKKDHLALPITIPEVVDCAIACHKAGADAIHAHVRDEDGKHVLDAGLYKELLEELARAVPDLHAQITTEAVGQFSPEEQRAVVRAVMPKMVSVAIKEQVPDDQDVEEARRFYHWTEEAGIAVQHILYAPEDIERLSRLIKAGVLPESLAQMLFVLGRYSETLESDPEDLDPFVSTMKQAFDRDFYTGNWAVCAFGPRETACLSYAMKQGGKVRVGFENSLWNADGTLAKDNAERVREIVSKKSLID